MKERLRARIEPAEASDGQLKVILDSATALYLKLKYPYTFYPADADGNPFLDFIAQDWILRCAAEMFFKTGADGQTGNAENGISRSWDNGTVSLGLIREIVPVSGVARAASAT